MDQIELMARWFDSTEHFARFLGVRVNTLQAWLSARRQPSAAALRLLAVMERIEATDLHDVLIDQARPAPKPPRAPRKRRVRGVNSYSDPALRAARPSVPVVRPVVLTWDDAYWHARTVTQAEADAGVLPGVLDTGAGLSDEQYRRWCDSLSEYERRTGRVMPD